MAKKKIEIIFDKHYGRLVYLDDYNKLKKEVQWLKDTHSEDIDAFIKEQDRLKAISKARKLKLKELQETFNIAVLEINRLRKEVKNKWNQTNN